VSAFDEAAQWQWGQGTDPQWPPGLSYTGGQTAAAAPLDPWM
jgi:hypothetical protein